MLRGKRSVGAASLALAGLLSLVAGTATAQAPRNVQTVYTNRAAFSLPVRLDDNVSVPFAAGAVLWLASVRDAFANRIVGWPPTRARRPPWCSPRSTTRCAHATCGPGI